MKKKERVKRADDKPVGFWDRIPDIMEQFPDLPIHKKWKWNAFRKRRADLVFHCIDELIDYHPITLRQLHYRLYATQAPWGEEAVISRTPYPNDESSYQYLSKILKWLRIDNLLSTNIIIDPHRRSHKTDVFEDLEEYLNVVVDDIPRYYSRCYVQSQENYVEIWCEKEALSRILEEVGDEYCLRTVTCRGYQSITFLKAFKKRVEALPANQNPVVLYFGDLDPAGWDMFEIAKETLEYDMELEVVVNWQRVAVIPEQIEEYNLSNDPKPEIDRKDKKVKQYIKRFGNTFVELDAFHPQELIDLAHTTIAGFIDIEGVELQREMEQKEKDYMRKILVPNLTQYFKSRLDEYHKSSRRKSE